MSAEPAFIPFENMWSIHYRHTRKKKESTIHKNNKGQVGNSRDGISITQEGAWQLKSLNQEEGTIQNKYTRDIDQATLATTSSQIITGTRVIN